MCVGSALRLVDEHVGWTILIAVILVFALAALSLRARRAEVQAMARVSAERAAAKESGSDKAQLQFPNIDTSQCIGCATCVRACPEEGVLDILHGQAVVVHGARCVGHGLCAEACPVGAIAVTLGDVKTRRDLPAITESFEVKGQPGLFLAGEVTGYALVRTAIAHGVAVASEVARRLDRVVLVPAPVRRREMAHARTNGGLDLEPAPTPRAEDSSEPLDLLIVGAGPAGIACSLGAKQHGLRFAMVEQEELGGTVAKYPRRKLVMTQPVELPLYGELPETSYQKEDLMAIWEGIVRDFELPLYTGEEFLGLEHDDDDGVFTVRTSAASYRARNVCLALGRRGTPRKLGVPGEELPKVAYSLLDAQSYTGRKIVVVGGGDSAIEAAMGLAEQPGNDVVLSYRKHAFFRIKARNEKRLAQAAARQELRVVYNSEVIAIDEASVELEVKSDAGKKRMRLANDEVFVFAGGIPPFELLEKAGVSFDPNARDHVAPITEQGTGIMRGLVVGLVLTALSLGWTLLYSDYYNAEPAERPHSALHDWLRPASTLGLAFGIGATVLIVSNLLYLLRRARIGQRLAGSLRLWLSVHMVTGVLAMIMALLHAGLAPKSTSGGHAFLCLVVLVVTGAIGRYFYSYLPKAANGRELAIDELRARMAALAGEWDAQANGFGQHVRDTIQVLVARSHWRHSFWRRLASLFTDQVTLRRTLEQLRIEGRAQGIPDSQLVRIFHLARRTHRAAQATSHLEDLRGLLASWRYFHRWLALLMVLLVVVHVLTAVRYGRIG
ncbi:MAG: NAD(P)-binding domain-containing protein [Planctomycetota bacterium]